MLRTALGLAMVLLGGLLLGCSDVAGGGTGGAGSTEGSADLWGVGGGSSSGTGGIASGWSDGGSPGSDAGGAGWSSGGQAGSGGESSGGSSAGGTGSGSSHVPAPSAGCALGSTALSIAGSLVGLPDGYDGSTPVPAIIGFHAAGNTNSQLQDRFGNTALGDEYLWVYPKSTGNGWDWATDKSKFETTMSELRSKGCIDESRVYAVGHSSGAQFIAKALCEGETRFAGVVPIASSVYCSSWSTPIPVLNIHGLDDDERAAYGLNDANGGKDIVPYRTSNGCTATTMPSAIDVGTSCSAAIHPGCVEFQGCSERTTWCNHDDPQYGTSNHGIPCFATSAIFDFLGSLVE